MRVKLERFCGNDWDRGFALVVSEYGIVLTVSLSQRRFVVKFDWPRLHALGETREDGQHVVCRLPAPFQPCLNCQGTVVLQLTQARHEFEVACKDCGVLVVPSDFEHLDAEAEERHA